MTGLSFLVMALLMAQSIFALGLLFQAIVSSRIRRPKLIRAIKERTSMLERRSTEQNGSSKKDKRRVVSESQEPAIDELIHACRQDNSTQPLMIAALCDRLIRMVDGGARSYAAFLSKTAPLLGLAGTLLGISEALMSFSGDSSSQNLIIRGFAIAIGTTLWGILIAFAAMFASRLIWQPVISDVQTALLHLIKAASLSPQRQPVRRRSAAVAGGIRPHGPPRNGHGHPEKRRV